MVIAITLYLDNKGVVPLALLACALHECGHLVALWYVRGRLLQLRLTIIGAEMVVRGELTSFSLLLLALAGPVTNIMVAWMSIIFQIPPVFIGVNIALAILNLVPLSPLDGGRALYALCLCFFDKTTADSVRIWLDFILSWTILLLGIMILVLGGSFTLLILAIWMLWTRKSTKLQISTCKKT